MIDEIRKQELANIRQLMKEQTDENDKVRERIEDGKKELNKKLA
jgi:hypothetical protein